MDDRKPWRCPDCHRMHAPHVDTCDCVPAMTALDTMIASEEVLKRDWLTPEEDVAWLHLKVEPVPLFFGDPPGSIDTGINVSSPDWLQKQGFTWMNQFRAVTS